MISRLLERWALIRGAMRAIPPGAITPETDPQADAVDPTRRVVPDDPRAETAVAALLVAAGMAGGGFVVAFVLDASTQVLGATLGAALALLAAALGVAAKRVVVQETIVEERPELGGRDEAPEVAAALGGGLEGVTRRRLIAGAGGIAATGLAAAAAVPLSSLGPDAAGAIGVSPWKAGTALVDEDDRPLLAADIAVGSFLTAFPEGSDPRELGSPVVVVRVPAGALRLPPDRRGWAPEGLLAFSKICTHAGCAVALFRYPLYEPTSKGPALVCPCHYSTFDVLRGGTVEFGPAARNLPQLPLRIAAGGRLAAAGALSGPVGPSWWGARHA